MDVDGRHFATVSVTRVVITLFADVPDEFAPAEAEGDLDTTDFRWSHMTFWSSVGTPVTVDTPMVQLYFELVADERRT